MKQEAHAEFAAFIGLDWADSKHDVCLQAAGSTKRECFILTHTPEAIDVWVSLSIEALRVYNPNTTRRSLSTSTCNCGPSRPRRRTMTDRSTAANLCVRKTDVTRRPVRVNSGWVLSLV